MNVSTPSSASSTSPIGLVRIEGLTRSFQKDGQTIDVLRGIDLSIAAGESVSIMGRSGAGKSEIDGRAVPVAIGRCVTIERAGIA